MTSSSSGESVLDSIKNATGLGEPTYTGQAKQGAHDLKEGAKSEFNSVSSIPTLRRDDVLTVSSHLDPTPEPLLREA